MTDRGPEAIPFQISVTREIYRQAMSLHHQTGHIILSVVACLLGVGLASSVAFFGGSVVNALPGLVMALVFLNAPVLQRRSSDKAWASDKLAKESCTGSASEWGLHLDSTHSSSKLPWDVFEGSTVREYAILIYQTPMQFHLFTPEFFAGDGDWRNFSEMVRVHTPKHKYVHWKKSGWMVALWLAIVLGSVLYFRATNAR